MKSRRIDCEVSEPWDLGLNDLVYLFQMVAVMIQNSVGLVGPKVPSSEIVECHLSHLWLNVV